MKFFFLNIDLSRLISSIEIEYEINGHIEKGIFVPYSHNMNPMRRGGWSINFAMWQSYGRSERKGIPFYNIAHNLNKKEYSEKVAKGIKFKPRKCGFATFIDHKQNRTDIDDVLG